MLTIQAVWFSRILHALRDLELDLRRLARHDGSAGLEEVEIKVAILRKVIEAAIESTQP